MFMSTTGFSCCFKFSKISPEKKDIAGCGVTKTPTATPQLLLKLSVLIPQFCKIYRAAGLNYLIPIQPRRFLQQKLDA